MKRVAFQLRLKPGVGDEYDRIHREVWPELIAEMEEIGIRQYSIFRDGQQLFLFMHVEDWEEASRSLARSSINIRWQERMKPYFEPLPDRAQDGGFVTMEEVFFMEGRSPTSTGRNQP